MKKSSWSEGLLFYCFYGDKKRRAFKRSVYFYSVIIDFFWSALLWIRIKETINTEAVVNVSRGGGVLEFVLPGRGLMRTWVVGENYTNQW